MARETGVVLKTQGSRCTVLTPRGEFRTVPRIPGPVSVGQEIEFAWPTAQTNWRLLLAVASLFVVLVAGTLFTSIFPAAGYVSVDINPSIELGINAWGRVVQAEGLNDDGKNLLRSLPLYGRPLDQALDSIAHKAVTLHFLKPGDPENLMVVTYTPGRLVRMNRQEQAYQTLTDQLKADGTPARLLFAEMTPAQRRDARKLGLSAGKYLVRDRLLKKGINVSAEQMAQTSIAKLLTAEKTRLDAIMGPNTIYREVMPPAVTSPGRTGVKAKPGGTPATPSRQQGQHRQAKAVQPSRLRGFFDSLRGRLVGVKRTGDSGISGGSPPSGGSVPPDGSEDRNNAGQDPPGPGYPSKGWVGHPPKAGQGRVGVSTGQKMAPPGTMP